MLPRLGRPRRSGCLNSPRRRPDGVYRGISVPSSRPTEPMHLQHRSRGRRGSSREGRSATTRTAVHVGELGRSCGRRVVSRSESRPWSAAAPRVRLLDQSSESMWFGQGLSGSAPHFHDIGPSLEALAAVAGLAMWRIFGAPTMIMTCSTSASPSVARIDWVGACGGGGGGGLDPSGHARFRVDNEHVQLLDALGQRPSTSSATTATTRPTRPKTTSCKGRYLTDSCPECLNNT